MQYISTLILREVIGCIGQLIVGRDMPLGWLGNIIGGLVGAWLGTALLGDWGPSLAGMALIPAIIGAIIVVFLVSLLLGTTRRKA